MKSLFSLVLWIVLVPSTLLSQWVVTNTNDSGLGSFRAAIDSAQAHAGPDTILFDAAISGQVITSTTSAFRVLSANTMINGDIDGDGDPDVSITSALITSDVLELTGNYGELRGVNIYGALGSRYALSVYGSNCTVAGCYIGTNLAGTDFGPSRNKFGIRIVGSDVTIGGKNPGDRNLISGSLNHGIYLRGNPSHRVKFLGNYIGTDITGTVDLGNGTYGLWIDGSNVVTRNIQIGDGTPEGRNLISGNTGYGIILFHSDSVSILGNYFGTKADGLSSIGGSQDAAISLQDVVGVEIGDGTAGGRNVIASLTSHGIYSFGSDTGIVILGNYIGVGADGTTFLPNSFEGIRLAGYGHQIGDGSYMGRNIIAGGRTGIYLNGSHSSMYRNWIGSDSSLTNDNGGSMNGIEVYGSFNNIQQNTVLGMAQDGIYVEASDCIVHGCFIGNGYSVIPNGGNGIKLANGATRDTVESNEIYNSGLYGIVVEGNSTKQNRVHGNTLINNTSGTVSITNGAQEDVSPPRLDSLNVSTMFGNAAPNGKVHLYSTDNQTTLNYVNTVTADGSGNWSHGLLQSEYVGIAQDSSGNSSRIAFYKLPGVFMVTAGDDDSGDPNFGSLRYALNEANGNGKPDTIRFHASMAGQTITLQAVLEVSENGTVIDGDINGDGVPDVTIKGFGLNVTSNDNVIKGLAIGKTTTGVMISAKSNRIEDNYIGLNATGTDTTDMQVQYGVHISAGNDNVIDGNVFAGNDNTSLRSILLSGGSRNNMVRSNVIGSNPATTINYGGASGSRGIFVTAAPGNFIGDGTYAGRNYILGNNYGIHVDADSTTIVGNFIGLAKDGSSAMGNGAGIYITSGKGTRIGNATADGRNVISGNGEGISANTSPSDVVIEGNFVGTDSMGIANVGNTNYGIYVQSPNSRIGGIGALQGNIVGGNGNDGINVNFSTASGAKIEGNLVGVGSDGSTPIANGGHGINVSNGAKNVLIRNNISAGHTAANSAGILTTTDSTTIVGNLVGLALNGLTAVPNSIGIWIAGKYNRVGGAVIEERNYISGNNVTATSAGISLDGKHNIVVGNSIGLDVAGNAVANYFGINVGSDSNQIGDGTLEGRNIVSGNANSGILISGGKGNIIDFNYVGTDELGILNRMNPRNILVQGTGQETVIRNNVSLGATVQGGIRILTDNNIISGNRVGLAADNQTVVGNNYGIYLSNGRTGNIIGGPMESDRNIVVGNSIYDVYIDNMHQTQILNNYIGVKADGLSSGGSQVGIWLSNGTSNTHIEGNVVAHHAMDGIHMTDGTTDSNRVFNNSIHSNGTGIVLSSGAQQNLQPPVINAVSQSQVSGTAEANALVQVYSDAGNQGETFLDTIRADGSGNWTLAASIPFGRNATALQDVGGNTSAFSAPLLVSSPLLVMNVNDAGPGSLREAINYANTNAGPDTIRFDMTLAGGVISPVTLLPELTDAGTVIDGDVDGDQAASIQINGNALAEGIVVQSSGNEIRHLSIVDFNTLLKLKGPSSNNKILGNKLGLTLTDSAAGYGTYGLLVNSTCENNLIGDGTAGGRNYVAGRGAGNHSAMFIGGAHNQILGNYVGLKPDGATPTPNNEGIYLSGDSNYVGDGTLEGRNYVAGNVGNSIVINAVKGNWVLGNVVGTNVARDTDLGAPRGIILFNGASNNHVGDLSEYGANTFVGSNSEGIYVTNAGTDNNEIVGNYIGIAGDGNYIGNNYGVRLESSSSGTVVNQNVIGGNTIGIAAQGGTSMNRFFSNTFYNQTTAIQIAAGSQEDAASPRIQGYMNGILQGTSAANALIQIYEDENGGNSKILLDTTRADGAGVWAATVAVSQGSAFTALQDSNGNTSAFAEPLAPAVIGAISPSPSMLQFGNVNIGSSSQLSVLLYSIGGESTIDSLLIFGDFTAAQSPSTPIQMAENDSVEVVIQFTPESAGLSSSFLQVFSNGNSTPLNYLLEGTGVVVTSGTLTALTSSANFGSLRVSIDSTTSELRLVASTASVEVTGLVDPTTGDFAVISAPSFPVTLTPGVDTLKLTVKFKPTVTGVRRDTLQLNSDASNDPVRIALAGTGLENVAPTVQVSVLRSTVVKHQIEIYTAADEFIQAISGTATLGLTTPLTFTTVNSQLYVSRYQLSASGTLNINILLYDAAGNSTNALRSYAVGSLSREQNTILASEDNRLEVSAKGTGYLLLGKRAQSLTIVEPEREQVSSVYEVFSTEELTSGIRLTFNVSESDPQKRYSVYRLENGQWQVVGGRLSHGQIVAIVDKAGSYAVMATDAIAFVPTTLELHQNYPNPFNPSTTIRFGLSQPGTVRLTLYNIVGQKVRELVRDARPAGTYEVVWDGRNDSGQIVSTGIYLYRLETGEGVKTRKMMFLK